MTHGASIQLYPGEPDVAVGTQQEERGLGNADARQLPVVGGIARDLVRAQQVTEFRDSTRRRALPDHEQIEPRVVEFLEQVLSGPARREVEPQPRETIARARAVLGQASQGFRQRTSAVTNTSLGDGAKDDPLYGGGAQGQPHDLRPDAP